MKLPGKTLVVCAIGFDRTKLSKFEFEQVKIISPRSYSHRGTRVQNLVFAGFADTPPADVQASTLPCLDRTGPSQTITTDGTYFAASGAL